MSKCMLANGYVMPMVAVSTLEDTSTVYQCKCGYVHKAPSTEYTKPYIICNWCGKTIYRK